MSSGRRGSECKLQRRQEPLFPWCGDSLCSVSFDDVFSPSLDHRATLFLTFNGTDEILEHGHPAKTLKKLVDNRWFRSTVSDTSTLES